jgi:hypothetical protein
MKKQWNKEKLYRSCTNKEKKEYKTMKRFMEFLKDFSVPEMRYFIISTWIL